ncbi:hypothetical protein GLV98_01955 [Halobacillus litoralis]|uniref:Uncharacterized protein n=1 Tax=Halobacillus litoralis TaxID=45668 RepID=A0A845DY80_9BACI|nr:hypothetical protein [Halobacillus litoralis]
MNARKLVEPTIELEESYLCFYNEWKDSGEPMIPWSLKKTGLSSKGIGSSYEIILKGWNDGSTSKRSAWIGR